MTFDLPKFKMLYDLAAQPMFRLVDAALFARAVCAGKAHWESFIEDSPRGDIVNSSQGEIVVGGFRHLTRLECGYPILTFAIREALEAALVIDR